MSVSSVFAKTLRDYRVAILGWGIGMGVTVASPMASVGTLITTPVQRASLASIAQTLAWNSDVTRNVATVGGYATFKIGIFIFLMAVWPLLAGSRTLRGEEERGSLDTLLALPVGRVRVAVEKVAAMWVALLGMAALIALVIYPAGVKFGASFSFLDALEFGLNLALACAFFGGLALLISQFTQERSTAAGWTGALLVGFIVVDMIHRIVPGTEWFSALSPIYYYDKTKPLVPGYGVDVEGLLVLAVLTLAVTAAAIWLFARRDVGGVVRLPLPLPGWLRRERPATRELPEAGLSLRSVYARNLGMIAWPAFWWTLGIAGWGAFIVYAVKLLEQKMAGLLTSSTVYGSLVHTLEGRDVDLNAGLLSAMMVFIPIFLMAFAVTQVNRWSADEQDGRLELTLATPQPRTGVLLARFAALATATILASLVTLLATSVSAAANGLSLDGGNLTAAILGAVPLGLLIAALGYLAAGWLRTAADTGLLSFLLAAWFFLSFVGPELKLPAASLRLSAFYYYGNPLLHGLDAWSITGLLAVSAVALGLATLRFARKDIAG